jgi:hypothetical protein
LDKKAAINRAHKGSRERRLNQSTLPTHNHNTTQHTRTGNILRNFLLYEVLVNKTAKIAPATLTTAISTNQNRVVVIPKT